MRRPRRARAGCCHAQVERGLDRAERAGVALGRAAAGDRADEVLARDRQQQRAAEGLQLGQPPEDLDRLARAACPGRSPGSSTIRPRSHRARARSRSAPPAARRCRSPRPATSAYSLTFGLARVWVITSSAPCSRAQVGQRRVGQAAHVVHHRRARLQRRPRRARRARCPPTRLRPRPPGARSPARRARPPRPRTPPRGRCGRTRRPRRRSPRPRSTSCKPALDQLVQVLGALAVRERVGRRVHDPHQRGGRLDAELLLAPAAASCRAPAPAAPGTRPSARRPAPVDLRATRRRPSPARRHRPRHRLRRPRRRARSGGGRRAARGGCGAAARRPASAPARGGRRTAPRPPGRAGRGSTAPASSGDSAASSSTSTAAWP